MLKLRHTAHGLFLVCFSLMFTACLDERKSDTYQGYVEGEFVYMASSQAGQLDRLAVTRGQRIDSNTLLFTLESDNEAAAQRQAQRLLDAAKSQLADLKTGKRPPEIAVIRAQLTQAVAAEKQSDAQLIRDQEQFRSGGISKAQLESSQTTAESNRARVLELQNQIAVAELAGRDQQIKAQEEQVAAAQASLDQANWKLKQKTVASRQAGLVFDTLYREGEWVQAGNPVVRMLPPENIKVRFFVPETTLAGFSVGQQVFIRFDGNPENGEPVQATITYIASECEYTPPIIYSNENRSKLVYMIEAKPDSKNAEKLRPGQPIEVTPGK